ncbi:MAG: Flp family type IVb pilin [Actinomycetota bacterium]
MSTALFVRVQNCMRDARDDRGAALAEYGLLVTLVALAAIGILVVFGGEVVSLFDDAGDGLANRGAAPPAAP